MCLYPKLIKNRKYIPNKKNGGNVPIVRDPRVLLVPIGCQRCIECKKQKARAWQVRLQEEIRTTKSGQFVTLTFSNESIAQLTRDIAKENEGAIPEGYELDNTIATYAVRRFLERWRKKYKISVKHWLITELGQPNTRYQGTENVHLHGIIFNNQQPKRWRNELTAKYKDRLQQHLKSLWQYGHVFIGDYVNDQSINYMVKYVQKIDPTHKHYNAKILTSAGIGSKYITRIDAKLNQYKTKDTDERYRTRSGTKINLPIYYRNKLYNDDQRENLWLEKLDKEERWVLGVRVSVKNGNQRDYDEALKWARAKNARLGYGNDEKNWDQQLYENQRRNLAMKKRLEKIKT